MYIHTCIHAHAHLFLKTKFADFPVGTDKNLLNIFSSNRNEWRVFQPLLFQPLSNVYFAYHVFILL